MSGVEAVAWRGRYSEAASPNPAVHNPWRLTSKEEISDETFEVEPLCRLADVVALQADRDEWEKVAMLHGRDMEILEKQNDTLRGQLEAAEAANETVSQWAAEVVATYEAKEAELINLRAANIAYSQQVNELIGRAGNAEARAEAAEAECARLGEVLDRIAGYTMSQFHSALDMASQCRTDAAMFRTKEETK